MENLWFCPTCGDFGAPRWEGLMKPRHFSANRGINVRCCGKGWRHDTNCNCGLTLIYCYRCAVDEWQSRSESPKLWFSLKPL